MTIQVVEKKYPHRGDRVNEEPSAKNAQGLFLPDACIFVGNLSTKVSAEDLAEDVKNFFSKFGPCHVKIKQDKKKNLPGAFVQFEEVKHAQDALEWDTRAVLHERWLRIEKAKGRRTVRLGLRSGEPITKSDVWGAVEGRGPVEVWSLEPYSNEPYTWTTVAKVTFAYVDDCRDAIKHFQKDDKYYMFLLDIDGNPLTLAAQNPLPVPKRKNGNRATPAGPNSGNNQAKNANSRPQPQRNGPKNSRAEPHLPPCPPFPNPNPHASELYPVPPFMYNGIPPVYATEPPPPPYYPVPYQDNGYHVAPPMMPTSQPGYNYPMPPPPVPNPNGPFIVNSHPPPGQGYYGEPFYPDMHYQDMGYYGPPPPPPPPTSMPGMPYMYDMPPYYHEAHPPYSTVPHPEHPQHNVASVPEVNGKAEDQLNPQAEPMPEPEKAPEEEKKGEKGELEKAPRLIRVRHDPDSDPDSSRNLPESKYKPCTGISVEEYVRRMSVNMCPDLPEEELLDVMKLVEEEQQEQKKKVQEEVQREKEQKFAFENDLALPIGHSLSRISSGCSLVRTNSSKSV